MIFSFCDNWSTSDCRKYQIARTVIYSIGPLGKAEFWDMCKLVISPRKGESEEINFTLTLICSIFLVFDL